MIYKSVIVFDVSGEYGHFRKFNTTTSPLTYSVPTPSAIHGLLGAILGVERENSKGQIRPGSYHLRDVFSAENSLIAIRTLQAINKVTIGFNLLNTKSDDSFYNIPKSGRTQIEYELLKNPKFRVYLNWSHELKDELIERLKNKRFHFTPYLGISQMTADVVYVDEFDIFSIQGGDYVDFITAINLSEIHSDEAPINLSEVKDKTIQVETVPIEMERDRKINRYGEILIETNSQVIQAIPNEKSFRIKEGNIQFL